MSAWEATGVIPFNPRRVMDLKSREITRPGTPPQTSIPATPKKSREVGHVQREAMLLLTRNTPASNRLKTLVEALGKAAGGAIADSELGLAMLKDLRSQAKDISAKAAKDRRHLSKARVITTEDVVALREAAELKRLVEERLKEVRKIRASRAALKASCGSNLTKITEELGEMVLGVHIKIEGEPPKGSKVKSRSKGVILAPEEEVLEELEIVKVVVAKAAPKDVKGKVKEVIDKPQVVTRSGRAVKIVNKDL